MITRRFAAIAVAAIALGGCAGQERAGTGTSVRAIMASQILPPQPAAPAGADGAAAVAGYANYQKSYVTPVPQSDNALVGAGITRN